jgi:phosphonate transport system substrate-binding protein
MACLLDKLPPRLSLKHAKGKLQHDYLLWARGPAHGINAKVALKNYNNTLIGIERRARLNLSILNKINATVIKMFCFPGKIAAQILLLISWVSLSFAESQTFYFTTIPDQDEVALVRRFEKLGPYLERKLGVHAVYVPASSYEAAVKAFVSGQVQLGWFGAFSGIKARHAVPGSQILAQGEKDQTFKSYFIGHVPRGLKPAAGFPRALEGKSFVFGSPISTSGRLIPEFWIRRQFGKAPREVFSRVSFSGDHSSTLDLVQSGAADAGALDYTVFEAAQKAGKIDPAKVEIIWETPPFPDTAFIIRGDANAMFGAGFIAKVRDVLIGIDDEDILRAFGRPKFVAASNEQYEFIEELASLLEAQEALGVSN